MWNCILLILQNGGDDVGMIYDDKLQTKQRLDSSQNKMGQLINGIDHWLNISRSDAFWLIKGMFLLFS